MLASSCTDRETKSLPGSTQVFRTKIIAPSGKNYGKRMVLMKKFSSAILGVILLTILLFFTSCKDNRQVSNNTTQTPVLSASITDSQDNQQITDSTNISSVSSALTADRQDSQQITNDTKINSTSPMQATGGARLVYRANDSSYGDKWVRFFCEDKAYSYDGIRNLRQKNWEPLTKPDGWTDWTVSMASYVIMQNRYLYGWDCYAENAYGSQISRLSCVDSDRKTIKWMDDIVLKKSPFVTSSKLNEKEFIYHYCDVNDESSVSVVAKYNITTNKHQEIIRETYRYIEGTKNSEGILLENVCSIDGKIYAFGRTNENGLYCYYIYLYDENGTLLRTIDAQILKNVLNNSNMVEMTVIHSYIMFYVHGENSGGYIFQLDGDQLCPAKTRTDGLLEYASLVSPSRSEAYPYLFYINGAADTDENAHHTLYGIECKTGKVKYVLINLEVERPYLYAISLDEKGNAIITVAPSYSRNEDSNQYYISSEQLLQLFQTAPYLDK